MLPPKPIGRLGRCATPLPGVRPQVRKLGGGLRVRHTHPMSYTLELPTFDCHAPVVATAPTATRHPAVVSFEAAIHAADPSAMLWARSAASGTGLQERLVGLFRLNRARYPRYWTYVPVRLDAGLAAMLECSPAALADAIAACVATSQIEVVDAMVHHQGELEACYRLPHWVSLVTEERQLARYRVIVDEWIRGSAISERRGRLDQTAVDRAGQGAARSQATARARR